jgi:hypothetical protein
LERVKTQKMGKEEKMTLSDGESSSLFKDLSPLLRGQFILPEDEKYHQALQRCNGRVNKRPIAGVQCADNQDVMHAVVLC